MKLKSINPATEELLEEFEALTLEQSIEEIKKCRESFKEWRKLDVSERVKYIKEAGRVLREKKKELGTIITKEMGKIIRESVAEVEKCAWVCDYYAEKAPGFLEDEIVETEAKKSYIIFQPLGIVMGIMPWNFPFWQVFRFAIPSLAAGDVCILKHSSNVPQCALAIEEVLKEAGFPDNVFKTLLIDSKTALSLIDRDMVDAVSLTGSTGAGKNVAEAAGRNLKKVVLELGGSDPFIVLEDADLNFSCEVGAKARMINTGQSCIAAKRFIVVEKIAKDFEERYVEQFKSLKIGNPLEDNTDAGPLAREDLVADIEKQVNESVKKGAKVLVGGKRREGKGYFYLPTVITNVTEDMPVVNEETFGPVAPIIVVKDEKEAIKVANNTLFGLGASIWTSDIEKGEKLAKEIETGQVFINGIVRSDPRLPFGGVKKSGYGRELSQYGLKEFVNIKTIVVDK